MTDRSDREKLADAMWDNFHKLPEKVKKNVSIMEFRAYVNAVLDQFGSSKEHQSDAG